ncbi:MAG: acyl-CoA dehydratase activase-related protein [Negativicutes bacterium]|nr:acyl-CoA dehydratase activase-related protein [Negativicutes bacterium]
MTIRVGVPRGLLYYFYGDLWLGYLRSLGAEAVLSGETSQTTLEYGRRVGEVCLPVKVAAGHACQLANEVDYLLLPRIVSVAAGQYSCPQIIGLPDLVRSCFANLPPLIDVTVNMRQDRFSLLRAVVAVGRTLGKNPLVSLASWQRARTNRPRADSARRPDDGQPQIGLIGHPYMIHDRQVSRDIAGKLRELGFGVITADSVDARAAENVTRRLAKRIFWHYCHRLAGAALALMYSPRPLAGMVFLTSFACGPDSMIGEILKRHASQLDLPFLLLVVDEHTAETGLVTRLEAFTDMLERRRGTC